MMAKKQQQSWKQKAHSRSPAAVANLRSKHRAARAFSRHRGAHGTAQAPFVPPEDWYEPEGTPGYRFVEQTPGAGYRHVVTPEEVRNRLAQLPESFTVSLEVVQFSKMTRKKRNYPCYGMQWGSTIYLYPIETDLVEHFSSKPKPQQWNEARMYGGQWERDGACGWKLVWSLAAVKDYYLNNILIHELGHLLDERNTSYEDRERYAEWFAVRYGYQMSQRFDPQRRSRKTVRRHHKR
ncbi:MAG: hypothetical protein MPJ50_11685 [Pirellulales bacterium]|nr:hypothetical protein [Pirellulales bacterium]